MIINVCKSRAFSAYAFFFCIALLLLVRFLSLAKVRKRVKINVKLLVKIRAIQMKKIIIKKTEKVQKNQMLEVYFVVFFFCEANPKALHNLLYSPYSLDSQIAD